MENLRKHTLEPKYGYERLYKNLYNPEFYLLAHQLTYAKPGNMSKGIDGRTFVGMSTRRIQCLISRLKDHSYHPLPVRRTYILKKNGKRRSLGIPSSDDKLVYVN